MLGFNDGEAIFCIWALFISPSYVVNAKELLFFLNFFYIIRLKLLINWFNNLKDKVTVYKIFVVLFNVIALHLKGMSDVYGSVIRRNICMMTSVIDASSLPFLV